MNHMMDPNVYDFLVWSMAVTTVGYLVIQVGSKSSPDTGGRSSIRAAKDRLLSWFESYLQRCIRYLLKVDVVFVSDPRALQEILVKEHETVFQPSEAGRAFNDMVFGPGLLSISGYEHKKQRKILNPVFTSLHTRSMASKFESIAYQLKEAIIQSLDGAESKEVNLLRWTSASMLETIGQAGFGYTFGAFQTAHSPYLDAIRSFAPAMHQLMKYRPCFPWVRRIPATLSRRILEWIPSNNLQTIKKLVDIQTEHARSIFESSKAQNSQAHTVGDNILSALLEANARTTKAERLSDEQVLGQLNTFLFAGHETSSAALARILHLLSENPAVQDRLRIELAGATQEYDQLPFLDALIRESLRLHSPIPTIERKAMKDWVLPLQYPNEDKQTEIHVKKGTMILLSLGRANRCRETWGDDAEEFRPERWLKPLPESVLEAKSSGVYSSTMTFSAGPRACIGFKFTVLELKIMVSVLVQAFRFSPGTSPVAWSLIGITTPHVVKTLEDGTTVLDKPPSLPLKVTLI